MFVSLLLLTLIIDSPSDPLLAAIESGDHARIVQLLAAGVSPSKAGRVAAKSYTITPLWLAFERGDAGVFKLLLKLGADHRGRNHHGLDLLSLAAMKRKAPFTKILLEAGADPNGLGDAWTSPLALYLRNRANPDLKLVTLFLAKGAAVDGNRYGNPLCEALQSGFPEAVELLMDNGADPNGSEGHHPIMLQGNQVTRNLFERFIEAGADINATNAAGQTPLIVAVDEQNEDRVAYLLKAGANVNARDSLGQNALFYVGTEQILEQLLKAGCDTSVVNIFGNNVLASYLLDSDDSGMGFELLKRGRQAGIHKPNNYGETARLLGMYVFDSDDLAQLGPYAANFQNPTPEEALQVDMWHAMDTDWTALWAVLKRGAKPQGLAFGQFLHIMHLLANGDDVDDLFSLTKFNLKGDKLPIGLLLSASAVRDDWFCELMRLDYKDAYTLAPDMVVHMLSEAPRSCRRELLLMDLDVGAANEDGETALHNAMAESPLDEDWIRGLLRGGADPEARNHEGRTPLGMAREHKEPKWSQLLAEGIR